MYINIYQCYFHTISAVTHLPSRSTEEKKKNYFSTALKLGGYTTYKISQPQSYKGVWLTLLFAALLAFLLLLLQLSKASR